VFIKLHLAEQPGRVSLARGRPSIPGWHDVAKTVDQRTGGRHLAEALGTYSFAAGSVGLGGCYRHDRGRAGTSVRPPTRVGSSSASPTTDRGPRRPRPACARWRRKLDAGQPRSGRQRQPRVVVTRSSCKDRSGGTYGERSRPCPPAPSPYVLTTGRPPVKRPTSTASAPSTGSWPHCLQPPRPRPTHRRRPTPTSPGSGWTPASPTASPAGFRNRLDPAIDREGVVIRLGSSGPTSKRVDVYRRRERTSGLGLADMPVGLSARRPRSSSARKLSTSPVGTSARPASSSGSKTVSCKFQLRHGLTWSTKSPRFPVHRASSGAQLEYLGVGYLHYGPAGTCRNFQRPSPYHYRFKSLRRDGVGEGEHRRSRSAIHLMTSECARRSDVHQSAWQRGNDADRHRPLSLSVPTRGPALGTRWRREAGPAASPCRTNESTDLRPRGRIHRLMGGGRRPSISGVNSIWAFAPTTPHLVRRRRPVRPENGAGPGGVRRRG
jgi:hypothetical protein